MCFYDQAYAGFRAARHLLDRGRIERLVFIAPFTENWVLGRYEGACQAIRLAGLPKDSLQFWTGEPDSEPRLTRDPGAESVAHLAQAAGEFLVQTVGVPAGIIGANDNIARHVAMAIAAKTGKQPGKDYALIGFDDEPAGRDFGLTSLRPPLEEMGFEATKLLLQTLTGDNSRQQVCLRSHLIPRRSTRL